MVEHNTRWTQKFLYRSIAPGHMEVAIIAENLLLTLVTHTNSAINCATIKPICHQLTIRRLAITRTQTHPVMGAPNTNGGYGGIDLVVLLFFLADPTRNGAQAALQEFKYCLPILFLLLLIAVLGHPEFTARTQRKQAAVTEAHLNKGIFSNHNGIPHINGRAATQAPLDTICCTGNQAATTHHDMTRLSTSRLVCCILTKGRHGKRQPNHKYGQHA